MILDGCNDTEVNIIIEKGMCLFLFKVNLCLSFLKVAEYFFYFLYPENILLSKLLISLCRYIYIKVIKILYSLYEFQVNICGWT